MSTITIELCAEDRARLDAIIAGLAQMHTPNCAGCVQSAVQAAVAIAKDPDNVDPAYLPNPEEHPADAPTAQFEIVDTPTPFDNEEPKAEEPKPAEPEPVKVELEKFKGAVMKYLENGGDREAVKAFISASYGVQALSKVPEDKRAEALTHFGIAIPK